MSAEAPRFNKIPAEFKLSKEGEELRRLVRQDLREMKESIALSIGDLAAQDIKRMRLEVQELLACVQKASESPPSDKQVSSSFGSSAPVDAAKVEGARCAATLLRDAADAQEQEVQRLRETVDSLAALLRRASQAEAERLQSSGPGDSAGVDHQLATDIGTALNELGAISRPPTERRAPSRQASGASDRPQTGPSEGTLNTFDTEAFIRVSEEKNVVGRKPMDDISPELERDESVHPFKWEWERSNNKGWAAYTRAQSHRIEKAWRSGASRVRLRSGVEGKTPMEIFLVDMMQLDPMSRNTRRVRRVGDVPWWLSARRHMRAILRQVKFGEPRWETYEQYRRRGKAVVGPSPETVRATLMKESPADKLMSQWRASAARVWNKDWVGMLTMTAVVCQSIWVYIDVDANLGKTIYEKPPLHQFLDYFFCLFFLIELLLHLSVYNPLSTCWYDGWFVFDLVCVVGSILEVIVVPPLRALSVDNDQDWSGFAVLRAVRLAKVIRIWRVFSAHSDSGPFLKGLMSGMRSSAFIWVIIAAMLYFFGMLLRLYSRDIIRDAYFPSIFDSMLTLMVKGVMLDEVGGMMDDVVGAQDWFSLFCFLLFVWLTFFNLLNMLVGAFCSVAGEVSAAEKERDEIGYLKQHLECIVECYIRDEGFIGKSELDLIMGNADVYQTLEQSGTDMSGIQALEQLLFHNRETVDFESLFNAIIHFRKGKAASAKDILNIQETLSTKLANLEQLLMSRAAGGAPQLGRDRPPYRPSQGSAAAAEESWWRA